jgi:hypothetical protein
MATISAYTTIEQSRKLAEILPLESADMFWLVTSKPSLHVLTEPLSNYDRWEHYPAWSLSRLIEVLPQKLICDATKYTLEIYKNPDKSYGIGYFYRIWAHIASINEDLVDACYEMILKLNELNLL